MCFNNLHQAGASAHCEVHFAVKAGDPVERRPVVKMDRSEIGIRGEDANPASERSQSLFTFSISSVIWRFLPSMFGTLTTQSHSTICPPEIRNVYKGIVRLQLPQQTGLTGDHFCSMGRNGTAMGRQMRTSAAG